MAASAISLSHVTFRYFEQSKRNILDDVSLEIPAGRITVLAGSSGCGKSTLAAVVAGLYPENCGILTGGTVQICGQPVESLHPAARARYLSMMFQNPDLQFCMDTLRKEMRFCLENISVPRDEMDPRIEETAATLSVTELLDRRLYTLSGGEKQKAVLTCLLLMDAQTLLLDEPFANIDESAAREIIELLLRDHQQSGRTIIVIDHRLDYWFDCADEIIVLGEGCKVLARGISKDNFAEYQALFDAEGLYYPGRFDRLRPAEHTASTVPALQLHHVTIDDLLRNVDAEIPQGSITALLGSSGCGKTTLFRTLLGEHKYQGSIEIRTERGTTELRSIRKRSLGQHLGIVLQNPGNQFITQNVLEEIETSLRAWHPELRESDRHTEAERLLEAYSLTRYRKYSPFMLSQGQQRRLAVLAVLAGQQHLLLLDEPTYGQDYRNTMAIMSQLRERTSQNQLSVLMATHDRALAEAVCDRIYEVRDHELVLTRA